MALGKQGVDIGPVPSDPHIGEEKFMQKTVRKFVADRSRLSDHRAKIEGIFVEGQEIEDPGR